MSDRNAYDLAVANLVSILIRDLGCEANTLARIEGILLSEEVFREIDWLKAKMASLTNWHGAIYAYMLNFLEKPSETAKVPKQYRELCLLIQAAVAIQEGSCTTGEQAREFIRKEMLQMAMVEKLVS